MHDATDMDLLRQYAGGNSDAAFAALVSRHVNLVYSAALRKAGNPHAAEEITQAVFIILAQKAGRIPDKTILPGWLYQTARLTAANFLKREIRRVRREQEAFMETELHATAPDDEIWRQLAPLLEDAMGQLGDKDRAAVVLRFFGGKSFAEVAATAGVSENAAKKRVAHALEKLRKFFIKRGIASTAETIAGAISAHSVQAAPVALAKSVTAVAIAKGAAASGSTLILVKGALKIMAWTKAKMAVVVGAGVLLAAGTATMVVAEKAHYTTPIVLGLQYQVEGTVTVMRTGRPAGEVTQKLLSKFTMCVSNCMWQLTLGPENNDKYQGDYTRLTFDGTNLYIFWDIETGAARFYSNIKAAGHPIPEQNQNFADAAVVEREVPGYEGTEEAGPVWLAYASGCYFKKLTTNDLEVTWPDGFGMTSVGPGTSVKRHAIWQLETNSPELPENVSYLEGFAELQQLVPRLALGNSRLEDFGNFTNAKFAVQKYANFHNLVLPQESVLDVYYPDVGRIPSIQMFRSCRYIVKAEHFRMLEKGFTFPPAVPVLTAVTDHRFNGPTDPAHNGPISYNVRDRFLTKEEARNPNNYIQDNAANAKFSLAAEKYSMQMLEQDIHNNASRHRNRTTRLLVIGVTAVLSVIFLTFAIRKMRSARKSQVK